MEINSFYLYSALSLGLVTGAHCVGMCGPIALSLGMDVNNKIKFYTQNFLYQLGRMTTYSILGGILGIVGRSFNLAGYQGYISIIAGVLLILMVLLPGKTAELGSTIKPVNRIMVKVKIYLGKFLQKKNNTSRYLTGVLNGILPCGAVYLALTSSIAAGGVIPGMLYMAFFGLGTFPFMFMTVVAGRFLGNRLRQKMLKIFPLIIVCLGILFILRGLELGIHLISPSHEVLKLEHKMKKNCCE